MHQSRHGGRELPERRMDSLLRTDGLLTDGTTAVLVCGGGTATILGGTTTLAVGGIISEGGEGTNGKATTVQNKNIQSLFSFIFHTRMQKKFVYQELVEWEVVLD